MCMCVFRFFFDITEATEDKVHVGPPRDRGENLFKSFRYILLQIWPGSAGLLAGN